MPKKKEPPLSPTEQRRRFEELARKSGAKASTKELRDALRRVAGATAEKPKKPSRLK
jgi:hypothetical protein